MIAFGRPLLTVAAAATLALTAGCGGSPEEEGDAGGRTPVTAAFYPLAYAVSQVGGDRVAVRNLARPGAEAHDLELAPRDVAGLARSALVVHLRGFQPAVDDAIASQVPADAAHDVTGDADLTLRAEADGTEKEGDAASVTDGADPHFWLDPVRYAQVVKGIGARLEGVDPEQGTAYRQGTDAFVAQLGALDTEFRTGLASCRSRQLVTGHTAFGYLAERYDLTQTGIAGVKPKAEPNAATMAAIVDLVRREKVTTVFAETTLSPAFTRAIAEETGAKVAVLDPVETVSDASPGDDYLEVMRANLTALRTGLGCT
ncbi:MAG TPA: metal ABC transporter substrate-binding protein [Dermatophilaceae bacterium]|nr:metal ABC transporter substrate-binding protein [Dermatophilaceae bacterium]